MAHENMLEKLEKVIDTKAQRIELNSQVIKKKGVYKLSEDAFILLYPDYLQQNDRNELLNTTTTLSFKSLSTNSREVYYIGPNYSYGKTYHETNDKWEVSLLKQKAFLELKLLEPFNSVLINKYTKNQNIPFHQDNEKCLGENPTIASISIGDTGKMTVKDKNENFVEIMLYPGTLLVMGGTFNQKFFHSVERISDKNNHRINFTFRFIKSSNYHNFTNPRQITHNTESASSANLQLLEKINSMKNEIKAIKSSTELQPESNTKIAIFKCPKPEAEEDKKDFLMKLLNDKLTEAQQLSVSDIIGISENSDKNGPLILELSDIHKKVIVLSQFKSHNTFHVRDCLSIENTKLLKKAQYLKYNHKCIGNIWTFRGDVYFSLPGSRARIRACWDNLNCLGRPGHSSVKRK